MKKSGGGEDNSDDGGGDDDDDDDDVIDPHLLGANNLHRERKDHHEDPLGPDPSHQSV